MRALTGTVLKNYAGLWFTGGEGLHIRLLPLRGVLSPNAVLHAHVLFLYVSARLPTRAHVCRSIALYGTPDDVPSGKPPPAFGSVPSSPAPRTPGPLSPSAGGGLRSPATDGPDTAASRYAGNKRAAQSSSIQFG